MMKPRYFKPLLAALFLTTFLPACGSLSREGQPWEPVYGRDGLPDEVAAPPVSASNEDSQKTWRELRAQAYQANTLGGARKNLTEFLANPHTYAGQIGEFEDAPHLYAVSSAQYELVRVYYLLGQVEAGDSVFRQLDPLDLFPKDSDTNPALP